MRSDALFYELFQAAPQTFFELLQLTPVCPYRFESITVKSSEKRIDGILEPEQTGETIYFLEVQTYLDKSIYWRVMREISTYFEQRPHLNGNEWQAVVLFLDMADDPGFGTLASLAKEPIPRLVSADLLQLLKQLDEKALSLNVLRPLVVDNELEVRYNVTTWTNYINQAPELSQEIKQRLIEILIQLIAQKFTNLTNKEITQMLRLTPLEETAAGKEILQNDRVKILSELIQLKLGLSAETIEAINARLSNLSLETLEDLFKATLKLETVEQLEGWLDERLPRAD